MSDPEILQQRSRIWARWEGAYGAGSILRTRIFWQETRPEAGILITQVALFMALIPVELRLRDFEMERWWFLISWARGEGEFILVAWLALWIWGIWCWYPVVPDLRKVLCFAFPLFGLPVAASRGWLDRSRWLAETTQLNLSASPARLVPRRTALDFSIVPSFTSGVVVTSLALAWAVDPQVTGAGREVLLWLVTGILHIGGWSITRSFFWMLPIPIPAVPIFRQMSGDWYRRKSLARHTFETANDSRRWAHWERAGRELSREWKRLPWRARWRGSGQVPRQVLTRTNWRKRMRSQLSTALFFPEGTLLGFILSGLFDLDLATHTPLPLWLGLGLLVSLILMLLGLFPRLLQVITQLLALSRDGWAELASRGGSLTMAVYLFSVGSLVGLLLASGELQVAGVFLAFGFCLLGMYSVFADLLRLGIGLLPFVSNGADRSARARQVLMLLIALLGVPLVALSGGIADATAWLLVLSAILSPAGHYLLWRST